MSSKRLRVGIIFGGRSAEHEVSLQSARNVYSALDKEKYEPILIGITKEGKWHFNAKNTLLHGQNEFRLGKTAESESAMSVVPLPTDIMHLDVVFPVLHGPYGEDGAIQGLLKLTGIPYVGAGVLGSAIGMDKDVMKRLLQQSGIPTVRYRVIKKNDQFHIHYADLVKALGHTLFVKPANLGSSVGVHKVTNNEEFDEALTTAFQYDTKVLVEEYIQGREIECAVLGNDTPIASLPGEILVHDSFYSYHAKYLTTTGAEAVIPADLSRSLQESIQKLAIRTFQTLCCEGMARVDFFLTKNNTIIVNEINTIPGFTNISMYPKMWEASGIPYTKLITTLIELALEKSIQNKLLKTSFM